ncbi:unnamed protein product [Trichobilharzia regenti]|nr:unnamed protein product [Trichobilharzia regenti]
MIKTGIGCSKCSNLDLANTTLDTAKVCLAQLAAAAAAGPSGNNTTGSLINQQNILSSNQQLQKAHQILRSLNVPNPLLSPLLSGNTSELDVSQTTPMSTSTTISSSPLLPPAPISYRGSITTANHNSIANNTVANITNASKSLQGGRHLENNALRNPNNITTTPVHCNSSSTGITSLTSNTPVATSSIVNNTSSVALAASGGRKQSAGCHGHLVSALMGTCQGLSKTY